MAKYDHEYRSPFTRARSSSKHANDQVCGETQRTQQEIILRKLKKRYGS